LLNNKIAVGTKGSIGFATAKRSVEEGACVFIADRRQAELDNAVAENSLGAKCQWGDNQGYFRNFSAGWLSLRKLPPSLVVQVVANTRFCCKSQPACPYI